jgi:AcrR family transcriptional regulator
MSEAVVTRPRAADRIRETARELFYRQGIRAVGVEQIVTEAGVTKPSLYRAFASKDELAAAYLRDYGRSFFERFHAAIAAHPGDPRAQVLAWIEGLAERAARPGYRGCGLTNAAVEYPDPSHPAHVAAAEHKRQFRDVLAEMARAMGARDPEALGDGLMLLMEGAYATAQLFGPSGPARNILAAAEALIDAQTG